jgi:hypothetical protein
MHLQKELLTPRYEVHQLSFERVLLDDFDGEPQARAARRERAAQVLLAAAGTVGDRDVRAEFGREAVEAKRGEFAARYAQRVFEKAQALATALAHYYERHPASAEGFGRDLELLAASNVGAGDFTDPWGNRLAGEGPSVAGVDMAQVAFRSLGPDGRKDSGDDFVIQGYTQRQPNAKASRIAEFKGKASVEQGAVAGARVAVEGRVVDGAGSPLGGVKVTARRVSNGKLTWVYTDARGRFTVPNLAPGRYDVLFESDAYLTTVYKTLALDAGARGAVEASLEPRGAAPIAVTVYPSYEGFDAEMDDLKAGPRDGRIRRREARRMDMAAAGRAPVPAPAMAKGALQMAANESVVVTADAAAPAEEGADGGDGPRVRSFFPETLYTNPALLTDGEGRASIRVPMADSITTWRVTSLASTARGALGSSTAPVRVFQEFFVDLDLPVSVTEGDEVSVPVAIYNYLPSAQRVSLELRQDPWFALVNDAAAKQVDVAAGEVGVAYFRIKAAKLGEQQLQVTARLDGGQAGDAVARTLRVTPDGEERAVVVNERLEGAVSKDVVIPEGAIPGASKIFVKFYPGALSQVVEGLDSILQMPGGCFEQTSSSTYPNVLVMDYLKTSKKITPEIQAKAEGYISLGYQRLVTFEVPGGGFSWFGEAPANKILTAYGLMEFSDMARVHEVDPRLIERTQSWLVSQQQPDGSFKPDTNFINEGATNRYNTDVVRITAYIGWALATTGYKGEAVDRARQYVTTHVTGREDAYTLAVIANFAVDSGANNKAWSDASIEALAAKAVEGPKTAYWKSEGETPTSARDESADLETTALAIQALLKSGQKSALAKKGLDYLTEKKDAFGNWQTTQATILSLKAFLLSFTRGTNADTEGAIEVSIDGKAVDRLQITRDNNDLLHMVDLGPHTHAGAHKVDLSFAGKGSMQYQIVGRYYVPWARRADAGPGEPLSIDVTYDRTRLAQDEVATARVRVRNNTRGTAKMIMVDLGIPPGFEPSGEDFASLVDQTRGRVGGKLEKYTITAKQIILYFDGLNPGQTVEFAFGLRAKFPVKAQTFSSRIYEYYNPTVEDKAKPVELTVLAK